MVGNSCCPSSKVSIVFSSSVNVLNRNSISSIWMNPYLMVGRKEEVVGRERKKRGELGSPLHRALLNP